MKHAAFGAAGDTFLLFLQTARQHDVGVPCRLGEKEIDYTEKLQPVERFSCKFGVGERDDGIETNRHQSFDLAFVDGVHDLLRGVARLGQIFRLDTPDTGDVLTGGGIMDGSRTRQLIAFLAVFAASLAVALAGDHGAAAAFAPQFAGGEREVDESQYILNTLRLMLQAARMQCHAAGTGGKPVSSAFYGGGRYARAFGDGARIVRLHRFGHVSEAAGVGGNEIAIFEAVTQHDVEHAHKQDEIGSGAQRQIQIGIARDGGEAGIGDDEFRTMIARAPDVIRSDGRAFADVGTDEENHVRLGDIAPGDGAAVDVECQLVRDARRDHAEASVVIDVARAEGHTGELAHQVSLLGDERCAAIDGDRVFAVFGLNLLETLHGEVKRFVPAGFAETGAGANEGIEQAVGMVRLEVALDALGTKFALIKRKLFPGFEPDHRISAHLELDSALLATEAAVRFHEALSRIP